MPLFHHFYLLPSVSNFEFGIELGYCLIPDLYIKLWVLYRSSHNDLRRMMGIPREMLLATELLAVYQCVRVD